MRQAGRFAISVPALAILGALAIQAVRSASADAIVYRTAVEMSTWTESGAPPSLQTWAWVHDDLVRATERAPDSPSAIELLGILDGQRKDSTEYQAEALVALKKALKLRPTSPYTWANVIEVMYVQGDTGEIFERSLVRAIKLGPWEPAVQRAVAYYGLAVWNEVKPATQEAIETAVSNGMRQNPKEMLQIAERRGRLAIACRWLPDEPRTLDRKSIQLCPGTGGTQ
jgi:predicted Zn-dependent protease